MSVVTSKLPKLWRYFGPKKRGPKIFLLISVLNWTILRRRTNSPCVDQFFPVDPVSKQRGENWISPRAYACAECQTVYKSKYLAEMCSDFRGKNVHSMKRRSALWYARCAVYTSVYAPWIRCVHICVHAPTFICPHINTPNLLANPGIRNAGWLFKTIS